MEKSRHTDFNFSASKQPQPPLPQGLSLSPKIIFISCSKNFDLFCDFSCGAVGSKQVHRQRQHPNLSPDSDSCGGGVADKDSFSFKFGWKSSKQLFGTPIKKLLAEEMSPKTEYKRRSPGVIARLMGLDGLPFQQPTSKQHKGLPENHLQKTAPLEKAKSKGVSGDGRSSRRSSKDQQEFKDVFEVSEIPKVESSRYPSQGCADLKTADAEISFIEQKFMDAKRLATYQDIQSSKDFRDTLEVLDSNKDLLLKYFKRPDSLFKKHLNDLQAVPLQSHFDHGEETMNIRRYENDFKRRSDRERARLNYNRSHQKHYVGYPSHFDKRHVMHSSPKSSKLPFKGKYEQDAVPTKIVVLKPNLGKLQNGTRIVSSPCSSHNFLPGRENDAEFLDVRCRDAGLCQAKNLPESAISLRHDSFESREIAREITRQMKNSLNNGCMFSSSRFRGYAGDDSSCCVSGNASPQESEEITATLGNSLDLNNRSRRSSHSSESSVSREAKKRLSERWKMTHKSQDMQDISRSSTLAEMLASPDKELKAAKFDSMACGEGFHDKLPSDEPSGWVEPLGISSRDGWKDGCIGSLSRSKSLPTSSTALTFGSPRAFLRTEAIHDGRLMVPKEAHKRERKRAAKSLDHRHGVNTRSTRSGHKKSWSLHSSKLEGNDFSPDSSTFQNKMKINLEDSCKLEVLAGEYFTETLRDKSAVAEDVVDMANGNAVGSSEPSEIVLSDVSCVSIKGNSSTVDKDNSMHQDLSAGSSGGSSVLYEPPVPGHESTGSKDADQPSPVSVLEPTFTDDLSCSECFGSLSADLQGLRMQLQLLKLESEEYTEGLMLISSDEDGGETSVAMLEDNGLCKTEDSWESSYIIDVLSECGIDGAKADRILEVSDSQECPLSVSVFDELEMRYCDWTCCTRSERRLLFDRINSGIVNIYKQSTHALTWVGPSTRSIIGSKLVNKLQDGLCRMLVSQEVKDDALGKVLVTESEWLDLNNHIDVIGMEVERLLLDDLVAEIAASI
ncbi:hypothetical protein RJT34_24482 [Clitoria ternatea]|uniref:DUF4378 domain-containing protein n=1 Tax=Clitoria ternatea TaxID=43366 RepID=A0AAN9II19_CLITE